MTSSVQTIISLEEEVSPEKMETYLDGKKLKEAGDKAFKEDPLAALRNYHKVLLHWKGLTRQNPATSGGQNNDKPKSQLDEDIEKVYSNMSACYLKLKKYDRAIESANQALALNKDNYKAMFRKAKALGEQGFYMQAEVILKDLMVKNPSEGSTFKAELDTLTALDRQRQKKADKRLKGFLNSTKDIFDAESAPKPESADGEMSSAKIEEVNE